LTNPHILCLAAAVSKVGGLRMQEDLAIPFLEKPENLDKSMPGYAGFDPLGFSNSYDIKWLQVQILTFF
jgi:hypothetical protein